MSAVSDILADLHARGVRIEPRHHGGVRLTPARLIDTGLLARIHAHKPGLLARVRVEREEAEIDRLSCADGWRPPPPTGAPAYSIVESCREHGVALRIDESGDLVVGKAGAKADEPTQPWPELLARIEAHLEAVAWLVEAGWKLKAGFPKQPAV